MAYIEPFRGIRYAVSEPDALDALVAPPYDVINAEQRRELVDRSEHNIVRIDLPVGEDDGRYDESGAFWQDWRKDGILAQDDEEALYLIEETFTTPTGGGGRRCGFVASLKLEDFAADGVRPHERTYEGPKADRLKLMRATQANISQIFVLYRDAERHLDAEWQKIMRSRPDHVVSAPDGNRRLWIVTDQDTVSLAREILSASDLTIADGHHRYETALAYRNECTSEGIAPRSSHVMAYLSNMDDPDLTILAAHRILKCGDDYDAEAIAAKLKQHFEVESVTADNAPVWINEKISAGEGEPYRFGLYTREYGWQLLTLRSWESLADGIDPERSDAWRALDVAVLHEGICDGLLGVTQDVVAAKKPFSYTVVPEEGQRKVADGEADLFFMVRPTSSTQITDVADAGDTMPQKSTYFYPKLLTGLVMRTLE